METEHIQVVLIGLFLQPLVQWLLVNIIKLYYKQRLCTMPCVFVISIRNYFLSIKQQYCKVYFLGKLNLIPLTNYTPFIKFANGVK